MDQWLSLFILSGALLAPALGHHLGYHYNTEKNRTKISFNKEPQEYSPYPGRSYYTYREEAEIKSDELLAWIQNQTKKAEPKKPEDYSFTKSHEIASWSQVAKAGEEKSEAPVVWYEKEFEHRPSNSKANAKHKDPISWVQFAVPKFPEKQGKIEYPSFEKNEQFEKLSHPASSYFTKDSVSWPPVQPKKSELKKKKPDTHWIWNHKLSKLEKVEKKQDEPKPKADPQQEARKATQKPEPKPHIPRLPIIREHGKVHVYTHEVPVPYEVKIEKEVRVPIHVPEERPVPYTVYKHIPVVVEKKVPVPVKVNVPYPVPIYKEVKVPVKLKEERLAPYDVHKHVPVYLERPVHFILEKKVPFPVKEIHESFKPYPVKEEKSKEPAKPVEKQEPEKKEEEQPKKEQEEEYPTYEYIWYKKPKAEEESEESKAEGETSWESFLAAAGESEGEPEGGLGNYYKTVEESQEGEEEEGQEGKEERAEEKEEGKEEDTQEQETPAKKSRVSPKQYYWYHES